MVNFGNRLTPSYIAAREPLFRLFDTFLGTENRGEELQGRTWTPPVDIEETENAYILRAELPGMTKDDIQITLENNVLRLSGERKVEKNVDQSNYHRVERVYGTFSRSFALPHEVDAEHVQAHFENGVLTLTVPKAEQARPRKIEIS
jgi:HSP20 family protein